MATQIGSFLTKLGSKQTVELTKQATDSIKAVFELAKTIKDKPLNGELLKTVQPYVGQISSLLDVLNSPLGLMVKEAVPFASIGVTLLNLVCEATQKDPTLEECMALVVQAAYLQSFQEYFSEDQYLMAQVREVGASEAVSKEIRALADKEISDRDAKKAMLCFSESEIAEAFNRVLQARLEESGLAINQAKLVCDRVSRTVPHVLNEEIAKAAEQIKPLADLYCMGGQAILERFQSLEDYLMQEIAPKPMEKVFDEERLTFQDLYVRLKVQLLDSDGKAIEQPPLDLETWTEQQLIDPRESNRVLFIQGEAGRGKSVFCRMFSDRVRQKLYPSFMPIVIRLRHLRALESNLTQTLENYLETWDFVTSDSSWLTDRNTRFLFLLDGFDELLLEGRASGGLKEFLQQVEDFQRNSHHRFVITGRPLSLQGIDRLITQSKSLARVAIQPMDDTIRQRWLSQWAQHFGTDEAHAFSRFLKDCPSEVNELAREPLLLYLLARLHREKRLDAAMLQTEEKIAAKVLIYDEAVQWVLDKQRENENFRLTGLEPEELRRFLTEAALCVVQAGNEFAPIGMLEMRCVKDANNPIAKLIQKARQETATDEAKALNSLLTAFYIKPASGDKGGSVEFTHKSFGEFLCAERLRDAIVRWTVAGLRPDPFYILRDQFNREIYDLLGSPVLSVEIVEYLMELLKQSDEFKPVELFERLNEFYELWCDGKFIDAPPENLPQEKMRLLREQLPDQEKPLGLRQVDVYAGLNVLILLLELHRYAQANADFKQEIDFNPCYGSNTVAFSQGYLSNMVHYSVSVEPEAFKNTVGSFLRNSNFNGVELSEINFSDLDLSGSSFRHANLKNVDFSSASISGADFTGAVIKNVDFSNADLRATQFVECTLTQTDFSDADMEETNLSDCHLIQLDFTNTRLSGANFQRAKLIGVNFTNTYFGFTDGGDYFLEAADLSNAVFHNVTLIGANFDSELQGANLQNLALLGASIWMNIRGLETARNVPIALKQQLGLE